MSTKAKTKKKTLSFGNRLKAKVTEAVVRAQQEPDTAPVAEIPKTFRATVKQAAAGVCTGKYNGIRLVVKMPSDFPIEHEAVVECELSAHQTPDKIRARFVKLVSQ